MKRTVDEILNDPSTFVLDVRTPFEFQGGSLPRAKLIPIDQLADRISELPEEKSTPILVYCAHGVRSLAAIKIIRAHGYISVFNLDGGLANYGRKSSR